MSVNYQNIVSAIRNGKTAYSINNLLNVRTVNGGSVRQVAGGNLPSMDIGGMTRNNYNAKANDFIIGMDLFGSHNKKVGE